jgi:cytoskeleton protein RodZ
MSDTVISQGGPADPAAPAARLGAELRARRHTLGWKLADLANSLRIRQAYLEAIEAGRIGDLPGTTYALGFVRAYASALGLPGEQMASRFRAESADASVRPALSFPAPVPQRGVPAGALMLLGLVILAGAYSGWYYISEHQRTPAETVPPIPDHLLAHTADKPAPAPSPQVASILPTASPPTQPAPAPPGAATQVPQASIPPSPAATAPASATPAVPAATASPPGAALPGASPPASLAPQAAPPPAPVPAASAGLIVVTATAPAWVTVKPQAGGKAVFNKLMHAGDSWTMPPGTPGPLLLTTGNAGATQLAVDGTPVVSLGPAGTVFRDLPLDAAMLKSGHLPPSRPPKPKPATRPTGEQPAPDAPAQAAAPAPPPQTPPAPGAH